MLKLLVSSFLLGLAPLVSLPAAEVAHAGCGCDKPAPAPAAVRPNVTYGGMPVTFFSPSLVVGSTYTVTFTAMSGQTATASGVAVTKRDLATATAKPQLSVPLPALPLGPARIAVRRVGATVDTLTVADTDFTVAPLPIALPEQAGSWSYPGQKAAVSRSGTVYLSLDLTGMRAPLIFDATLAGYPLRFTEEDVLFKNVQGFLMQELVTSSGSGVAPIPGMFVQPAAVPAIASDTLHYSRHEFSTYFLQHAEREPHATDPTDPNWHVDGSAHIDHDHLIIAIVGNHDNGSLPAPGATPAFVLQIKANSLFYNGLVGATGISMSNTAATDSFDPATGYIGQQGDLFTGGTLTMTGSARIDGDATAKSFAVGSSAVISGTRTTSQTPLSLMQIQVPAGLPTLANIALSGGASATIVGPGSFAISKLSLSHADSRLYVDNSAGPVTLYVRDEFKMSAGAIVTADPKPEKFAVYVAGTKEVALKGGATSFYGVIYAPNSAVSLSGSGVINGAFVGKSLSMSGSTRARYDSSLKGE